MSTDLDEITTKVVKDFMELGDNEGRLYLFSNEGIKVQRRLRHVMKPCKKVVEKDHFSGIPNHLYPLAESARAWGRAAAIHDYYETGVLKGGEVDLMPDLLTASRAVTDAQIAVDREIGRLTSPDHP
jgi:hypothetical protein